MPSGIPKNGINKGWFKKGEPCKNKRKTCFKKGYKFPEGIREKIGNAQKGCKNHNWKGGRLKTKKGYIMILNKNHPFSNCAGYIFEHRLVVERYIGRYLTPEEVVHHFGKKDDNRPHMLMAFVNNSIHKIFHKSPMLVKPEQIIFDGRKISIFSSNLS